LALTCDKANGTLADGDVARKAKLDEKLTWSDLVSTVPLIDLKHA
jgi:hypothetical protein